MRVLVVDQAKKSGYAVFNDGDLVDYGLIKSNKSDYTEVIKELVAKTTKLILDNEPDLVVFEDVVEQISVKTHKDLSMLLGSLTTLCHIMNVDCKVIHTSTWRKILRKHYGIKGRPKRDEWKNYSKTYISDKYGILVNDDIADAITIGLYHYSLTEKV